jgi:MIP family channel proteins
MPLHKSLIAEFIGTFFLCFAGIAAILSTAAPISSGIGLVGIALAHGLALSIAVAVFGGISGAHFNPAVTLGMLSVGRIKPGAAGAYVVTQIAGALAASAICFVCFPISCVESTQLGIPLPGGIVEGKADATMAYVTMEFVMTFLLMTAIFGTAVDSRGLAVKIGGFGIGLTVAFNILAGGAITGASMNPARSLGPTIALKLSGAAVPDLMSRIWQLHWIYWVAPVAGAVLAAQIYEHVLLDKPAAN